MVLDLQSTESTIEAAFVCLNMTVQLSNVCLCYENKRIGSCVLIYQLSTSFPSFIGSNIFLIFNRNRWDKHYSSYFSVSQYRNEHCSSYISATSNKTSVFVFINIEKSPVPKKQKNEYQDNIYYIYKNKQQTNNKILHK